MKEFDAIIVGAGAAGLMCAQAAAQGGKKILLLEHNDRVGKKILISGGGRCNFTNLDTQAENFISKNLHFPKSALARFQPEDFIKLIEKHQILFFEKKLGQLFCKKSAKEITQMLLKESEEAGVEILLNCKIQNVGAPLGAPRGSASRAPTIFTLLTNLGTFTTPNLIIATGGLSFKSLGATSFAYKIAKQFDINVITARPGLVPLLWNPEDLALFSELSGVSIDCEVTCRKKTFRENLLFTHRGLSGPAILQISSYWCLGDKIRINLFPDLNVAEWLIHQKNIGNKSELKNVFSQFVSKRFLEIWFDRYFTSKPLLQISDKDLQKLAQLLQNWEIKLAGDEGYDKAEVTRGGIDTEELSSQSMESKKVPGLYFIGECVDVTGHLGGHNFQWAWASAMAAASSL